MLNNSERNWIDGIIEDTESALRGVARLIEPARVDKATKEGINFGNRFMWVFRDNPQVRDKHTRLSVCHQSLTAVIACLYSKDVMVVAPAPDKKKEEQPPPYDMQLEELFNWRNGRRRTKSVMSLQSVATGSSVLALPLLADTMVASATSSAPTQSDDVEQDPPLSHPHSASGILMEPHHHPTLDMIRRPMSVDAVPIGRIPTGSSTPLVDIQKVDWRRPVSVDGSAPDKPLRSLIREAKAKQRQADEQSTNSRLPYPMSPSDYMTGSTLDCEESEPISDFQNPVFSGLEIPYLKGTLSNFNTMNHDSSTIASDDINSLGPDLPHDQSLVSATGRHPSTSQEKPGPYVDRADGSQLLTKQRHMVDEQYQHPPFSFTSFAPLTTSDDDSPHIHPKHFSQKSSTCPADEDLHSIAELDASVDGPSDQGQECQPDLILDERSLAQDPTRSPPMGPGRVRRGGRSWLKFHASRSDLGHYAG